MKRNHYNSQSKKNEQKEQNKQGKKTKIYGLDKSIFSATTLQYLQKQKRIYEMKQKIKNHTIYFPYQQLNNPQKILIKDIFETLQSGQNLLAESSTGTGKTLSLLIGTLVWADNKYNTTLQNSKQEQIKLNLKLNQNLITEQQYNEKVDELKKQVKQYKVIYTSRAHSQLSQIQKELQKTPYRPRMLVFGSKKQLCINQTIKNQGTQGQIKQYEEWYKNCHVAVKKQKQFLQNKYYYYQSIKLLLKNLFQYFKHQQLAVKYKKIFTNDQMQNIDKKTKFIIDKIQRQDQFQNNNNQQLIDQAQQCLSNAMEIIQIFMRKKQIQSSNHKQQIKRFGFSLKQFKSRCNYYHQYEQGHDLKLFYQIDRSTLNSKKLKQFALKQQPPVCPFFYPKRIKYLATLYLMPYNYLLDSKILQYSKALIQDSIIIFDQGHNVPNAACAGYSFSFNQNNFHSCLANIGYKNINKNIKIQEKNDIDELQTQKMIHDQLKIKIQIMLLKKQQSKQQSKGQQQRNKQQQQKLKKQCNDLIELHLQNFQRYFQIEREQFLKPHDSQKQLIQNISKRYQESKFHNAKKIRYLYSSDKQYMEQLLKEILFSHQKIVKEDKSFEIVPRKISEVDILNQIKPLIIMLNEIISQKMQNQKFYFKILNFKMFFENILNILYHPEYASKFYLQINQFAQFNKRSDKIFFKGELQIKCLDPSFAFKLLQKIRPRSIIIASGTLSPMNVFKEEIGLRNLKMTSAGYVITSENIKTKILAKDLNGDLLKITSQFFQSNNNNKQILRVLSKIIEKIPKGGVLVVLPSFSTLNQIQKFYKSQYANEIRQQILKSKPYVDFQSQQSVEITMKNFKKYATTSKGALLFCVVRAKLSQGIDFKDQLCRSVIFLGIPHLNKNEPFIVQKQKYLKKLQSKYADQWCFIQASKAINQALGRVVRHACDYGSIILVDSRYSQKYLNGYSRPVIKNISDWISKNLTDSQNIYQLRTQLQQFYKQCKIKFPMENTTSYENNEDQQNSDIQSNLGQNYFKNRQNDLLLDQMKFEIPKKIQQSSIKKIDQGRKKSVQKSQLTTSFFNRTQIPQVPLSDIRKLFTNKNPQNNKINVKLQQTQNNTIEFNKKKSQQDIQKIRLSNIRPNLNIRQMFKNLQKKDSNKK